MPVLVQIPGTQLPVRFSGNMPKKHMMAPATPGDRLECLAAGFVLGELGSLGIWEMKQQIKDHSVFLYMLLSVPVTLIIVVQKIN